MTTNINVVYIGPQQFPIGAATSKRRRYMVDYMNNHGISNHVLVTRYIGNDFGNPLSGRYGSTDFLNIHHLWKNKRFFSYYKKGRVYLKDSFDPTKKNILIFSTVLDYPDYFFYRYAIKLGYKVVFDQVETSYLLSSSNHTLRWWGSIGWCLWLNEKISQGLYPKNASFVISNQLFQQNIKMDAHMPLCILQNATKIFTDTSRTFLNYPLKVLYSGTYATKDGVDYLLEGVRLANEKGFECKLILLGNAPQTFKEKCSSMQYCNFVEFTGFVPDDKLIEIMLSCDVLAMTRINSKFANYGFPFKLSEYLGCGNVVLATKVGDVEEYLEDKKSAYLVAPESSESICDTIIHIINNPEEAFDVSKQGLLVGKEEFGIEPVGKIFENFLNRI